MKNTNNIEALLSKERLTSYSSIEEHFLNLKLIGQITPKIATLEIVIRNSLDILLIKDNPEWLRDYKDEKIQIEVNQLLYKDKYLSHHQLLSRMTLGIIIRIIRQTKLETKIFDLRAIQFTKYDSNNKKFYKFNGKKGYSKTAYFTNINKADIFLSLFINLRNRCYHWENILKTRNINQVAYTRITTRLDMDEHHYVVIGILPDKIEVFLTDIMDNMI